MRKKQRGGFLGAMQCKATPPGSTNKEGPSAEEIASARQEGGTAERDRGSRHRVFWGAVLVPDHRREKEVSRGCKGGLKKKWLITL